MKNLILAFFFLSGFNTLAQPDSSNFDHVFYDRDSMLSFVFGNIDESYYPTTFLLDKNLRLDDEWKSYVPIQGNLQQNVRLENWFELYRILHFASNSNSDIREYVEINHSIIDHLYSGNGNTQTTLSLPILGLDYNVNLFAENAEEDEHLIMVDNQFTLGIDPDLAFEERNLFFAGLWLDSLEHPELSLFFDEDYIQGNSQQVTSIKVNCSSEEFLLFPNESCLLSNLLPGLNTITFTFIYSDNSNKSCSFDFFVKSQTKSVNVTNNELQFFDAVYTEAIGNPIGNEDVSDPSATWCIKYGCNNNTGAIRKPVIFVAGFGMASPYNPLTLSSQSDCVDLYLKYNIEGLCNDLRNKGHDVIIVRFVPAVADIIEDAQLLATIISAINIEKTANGSHFENIIIGYSAGALVVRYALDQMEKLHLENNGPHPHTKLYTSFEGEHNGAYIPLGAQIGLNYFIYEYANSVIAWTIHYMANSPQAKQLLKYFRTETPFDNTGSISGQGPHDDRNTFLQNMESDQILGHSKQNEKFGYYGFPAFSRNISIANGGRYTNTIGVPNVENSPYFYEPAHTVYENENLFSRWTVNYDFNSRLIYDTDDFSVFQLVNWNLWGNIIWYANHKTDIETIMWGKAPGGFLLGPDDMLRRVFQKMHQNIGLSNSDIYDYIPHSFTPTIANHGIRNYNPVVGTIDYSSAYPYQILYNFQDKGLMYNNKDVTGLLIQSDYFGYPALGHPSNHYEITPFEALYTDEWNQTHISSLNTTISTPILPDINTDMMNDGYVPIKSFILDETEPIVAYLQNQRVGWNTNGAEYKAQYEAQYAIFVGEEVTYKTDINPYEIWDNGDISCKAETAIIIRPGFHAHQGSEFHAEIGNVGYVDCPPPSHSPENLGNEAVQEQTYLTIDNQGFENTESNEIISVYPNPSNENSEIYVVSDEHEMLNIKILDISGKLVYKGLIIPNVHFNPGLDAGTYIMLVEFKARVETIKLIIN